MARELYRTNWLKCCALHRSHVWLFSGAEGGKWLEERKAQWTADVTSQETAHTQTPREAKKLRTQ